MQSNNLYETLLNIYIVIFKDVYTKSLLLLLQLFSKSIDMHLPL